MGIEQYSSGLQHVGIPTDDIKKTIEFYTMLGFHTAHRAVNEAAGGEKVAFLRLGNLTIETYENHQAAMVNGAIDHIALDVTDIEAVWQFAKAKGLDCLDEEIQFLPFWEKGVRFFTILGPNKEKVEFSQML